MGRGITGERHQALCLGYGSTQGPLGAILARALYRQEHGGERGDKAQGTQVVGAELGLHPGSDCLQALCGLASTAGPSSCSLHTGAPVQCAGASPFSPVLSLLNPYLTDGETEAECGARAYLVGQPSLRVTLSAVSPSVMVTLRRFMWLPLGPEGLAGLAALPLPWPRP